MTATLERPRRRLLLFVLLLGVACTGFGAAPTVPLPPPPERRAAPPPWEVWADLSRLAVLEPAGQVLLRSSHCLDGCRFDRHSADDPRFIRRLSRREGVIFEETGPGAITRIWMTSGADGGSLPLDPDTRIRFYFDGEETPRLDLALPELFNGSTEPFTPPLAADRPVTSGGNFSYVPLPYQDGCRVTLSGADNANLWFQFTFHRLPADRAVATWSGDEDLSALRSLLAWPGSDPWPAGSGELRQGALELAPGEVVELARERGEGLLTALRLTAAAEAWPLIYLRLTFDGEPTVELPLADFFAVGRGGPTPTRSLLTGVDASGWLYSYFPMPFFDGARVEVASVADAGTPPLALAWQVRRSFDPPLAGSGRFGADVVAGQTEPDGGDLLFLDRLGRGRWVGLFAELGAEGTGPRRYLEGDERLYLDGSRHPGLYGTGVEDFYNSGFYFDQGPVRLALSGMTYQQATASGEDITAAYRLLLTDAVPFGSRLIAGLEGGPQGDLQVRGRLVTFHYTARGQRLIPVDRLILGDPASVAAHGYEVDGPQRVVALDGLFEGEPPFSVIAAGVERDLGTTARFTVDASRCGGGLRLRRRFDAGAGGQAAVVTVDATLAASLPPVAANPWRRWREVDVELPDRLAGGRFELAITAVLPALSRHPRRVAPFNEYRYELFCRPSGGLFNDGFDSGNFAAWYPVVGAQPER